MTTESSTNDQTMFADGFDEAVIGIYLHKWYSQGGI